MIWPFGDGPIGAWLERRRAFKDLDRVLSFESETLSLRDDNPLHRAKVSLQADDPQTARHFLNLARERIPDYVLTSPDTVEILLGLRDFVEADALTLKGAKRFPREPRYLEGYALSAETRRDFAEAVVRWAAVRKKFPYRKPGYISASYCLRNLGRIDEAERLVGRVMRLAPGDMGALLEWGRVAEARGDWEEAHRRWDSLRDKHPQGYVGASEALHKLGRVAEAEALLTEARLHFPIYEAIPLMYARIATESGDPAEALKRWAFVRQRFPFQRSGYSSAIQILREQQQWAEADAIAQEAIERFPAHPWPLEEYATLAQFRRDWAEAAKRWAALLAAFPDHAYARERQAQALAASGVHAAATAVTSPPAGSG
jgi:tetratricopeptide (TPR) repeat protein